MRGPVGQLTVDFNDSVLLTSLQASDLTVNGVPATGLTVLDGNTVAFQLPNLGEGVKTFAIAAGAVRDVQGTPLAAFTGSFYHDVTPPRVVSTSVQENQLFVLSEPTADLTLTVRFSEAMRADTLEEYYDFNLYGYFTGAYATASWGLDATGTVLTLSYSGLPEDAYTLVLTSGDGAFEDTASPNGWNLDGDGDGAEGGDFLLHFYFDAATASPYPTPLSPQGPLGSLVYEGWAAGLTGPAGDTWTLAVEAGQTVAVTVQPVDGNLRPTVTLTGPGLAPATATAPGRGQQALLQAAGLTTGCTY